ncbi:MAG: glucose-1-phosphate adenylyltransferase [Acholeplasmatales bacterium]|nr:glucose-1-phosphate adenylyltransferase [Acholeplasmatales bacterium]
MINKKECVAMLLAGGQGSRLYALTNKVAKPAVSFGAKYRIIDFGLSNCTNSNIDTVGVLTQYQPLLLNEYIGNGQPWDLDRTFGGVRVLPPYQGKTRTSWYKGTANAIYQNINFIKQYDPDYVLILSGDHIYKMDYAKMLQYHKDHNADVTIAAYEVTLEEATRFGVLNTTDDLKIYEFEEKPKQPKSTHASMGIYVFNASTLYKYLEEDEADTESENDFGKNIIPNMLKDGLAMYAYPFRGYWKDVGTISSLWEANMDLLGAKPKLDIHDPSWEIYSRNLPLPPQKISEGSVVKNSLVTLGCYIQGTVINSLISSNVTIKPGAVVKDSVIFENAIIEANAVIEKAIVAEDTFIGEGAKIGSDSGEITVIGPNVKVYDEQTVEAGAMVEKDVK